MGDNINFALQSCVQRGLNGVAKLPVNAHADPSQQDEQGWTMFDWAVSEGHEDIAIELLARGGLGLLQGGRGYSHIIRLARSRGMHRLAEWLEQQSAQTGAEHATSGDAYALHHLLQHGANADALNVQAQCALVTVQAH